MMIERLTGIYAATLPTGIILDVNGVGYGVEMPLSSLCRLQGKGETISLWTYTYVREDQLKLFGFLSYEDRLAFETLLSISGVGPKMALAILSTLSVAALRSAVARGELAVLEVVPGIGKRLAEKIMVDLKPKLKKLQRAQGMDLPESLDRLDAAAFDEFGEVSEDALAGVEAIMEDLRSAMENLGFKEKAITPLFKKLEKEARAGASFQDLMKKALVEMGGLGSDQASLDETPAKTAKPLVDQRLF